MRLVVKVGRARTAREATTIPAAHGGATVDNGSWVGDLRSHWWGAFLIGLLAALIVLAMLKLAFGKPRKEWLRERLEPWQGDADEGTAREQKGRLDSLEPLFMAAESRFSSLGFWQKLERVLEQADSNLSAAQLFYLSIGFGLVAALLAALFGERRS